MKPWHFLAIGVALAMLACFGGGVIVGSGMCPEPPTITPPDPALRERIISLRADSARLSDQSERLMIELAAERASTPPVKDRVNHAYNRSAVLAFDSVLNGLRADPPEFD